MISLNKMKVGVKVAIFTTTRAEFGILSPLIRQATDDADIEPLLFVGGTHLAAEHGNTVREIINQGFKISGTFDYLLNEDTSFSLGKSVGIAAIELAHIFEKYEFDFVCVLGDRFELLSIISNAIFASDTQKKFIPYMTLGAIVNVILNIYLISKLGAPGAAIATVISQFATYGWVYYVLRAQIGLAIARSIYKIVIAAAIMGIVTWGLKQLDINLLLTIALATVIYFTLLWILKEPLLEKLRSIITRTN